MFLSYLFIRRKNFSVGYWCCAVTVCPINLYTNRPRVNKYFEYKTCILGTRVLRYYDSTWPVFTVGIRVHKWTRLLLSVVFRVIPWTETNGSCNGRYIHICIQYMIYIYLAIFELYLNFFLFFFFSYFLFLFLFFVFRRNLVMWRNGW